MLVGVRDAAVVLFLVFVLDGVGRGIAAQPELFDELLALLVGVQLLEGFALFIGDDVGDVFVQPLLPGRLQLFLERRFFLLDLFRVSGLATVSRLGAAVAVASVLVVLWLSVSAWPHPAKSRG